MFPIQASFTRFVKVRRCVLIPKAKPTRIVTGTLPPHLPSFARFTGKLAAPKTANTAASSRSVIRERAATDARWLAGTVLMPDFAQVNQAEVIESLPSLRFPHHDLLRVLTFFITPEFLHWFDEENKFVQNALKHIYQDWPPSVIQCRVAVVDRIPFPEGKSYGYPGISFALGIREHDWSSPSRLMKRSADPATAGSEGPLVSFTLRLRSKHGKERRSGILLRPANTLFVNGRRSTMFVESWQFIQEIKSGRELSRQGSRGYVDHFKFVHRVQSSSLNLPLQRLTEARKISMCMGNVISKLAGEGDSDSMSASLELEGKVSALVKSRNVTDGMLAVFALIKPESSIHDEATQGQALPTELLGYRETAALDDIASQGGQTLNSIRLAISKGAHLHRVTSGGGGWGKKEGLLSLEPAIGFDDEGPGATSPSASEDLDGQTGETGSFWAKNTDAEITRPGDAIEFYGMFSSTEEEQALTRKESLLTALKAPNTRQWLSHTWAQAKLSNIVLGVIPPQHSHNPSTIPTLSNELITVPHQFGMLSENGIVLENLNQEIDEEAIDKGTANVSRIDAPHTVLHYSIRNQMGTTVHPTQREAESSTAGKINNRGLNAVSRGKTNRRTKRREAENGSVMRVKTQYSPLKIRKHFLAWKIRKLCPTMSIKKYDPGR